MAMAPNSGKKRLQFDFTEEASEELNELQRKAGFASKADLIRHALRLFQWVFEETQEKHATLLIQKNGEIRELEFPFWKKC